MPVADVEQLLPLETATTMEAAAVSKDVADSPDFLALLQNPYEKEPLPKDFNLIEEAKHLTKMWSSTPDLNKYDFVTFIHAGGSGMVFEVRKKDAGEFDCT